MATGLENLKVYQLAKELEIKVFHITKDFPRDIAMCEAEETRSNITVCAEKNFTSKGELMIIAENYLGLIKAISGYIRFLKTNKPIN